MKSTKKPTYEELEKLIDKLELNDRLKRSEDRFKTLLKAPEDMISIHNLNGKYLYYSGPTYYVKSPEDIVGKTPSELFKKDVSDTLLATFKKVTKTGEGETVEILLDWLGKERWVSQYIYPIKNTAGEVTEMVKICKNIHTRKLAEQEIEIQNKALLESEKAYRGVVEASNDLITVVDGTGKIVFVNHASKKFYGLPPNECLGKLIIDFTHPEDKEYTQTKFIEWETSENNNFDFENKQISVLGIVLETEWSVNVHRKDKKIIKITSIIRDITKQNSTRQKLISANKEIIVKENFEEKQATRIIVAEEQTEEIEERFSLLMRNMEAGIVVHAPDTSIIINNIRASKILKLSNDQLRGKKAIDPSWKFLKSDKTLLPLKEYPVNKIVTCKKSIKNEILGISSSDKEDIVWVSVNGYPALNDNNELTEIVISFIDITEQVEVEEEKLLAILQLKDSDTKLKEAQKLAQVGSWFLDLSNDKRVWSEETFRIWGFDSKKDAPEYDALYKRVHIDDQELFSSSFIKIIKAGTPYDIECRICLPNGEEKSIKAICTPELDDYGKVISLTGTIQDITLQKQLEKAQVKHERLKAMGQMSSSIAHDFNNSLQQMTGNLEIIKFQKGFSNTTIERLNNIEDIIDDVADRVSALQKLGDTENENKNVQLIDFNTLIEEGLNQSRPLWKDDMEKKGLSVTITTDFENIPRFLGNRGELKSVFFNLIKNSIEAMPKGGAIVIKTFTKEKRVYATFTDTGIGMDEETKIKVFEPFFTTKGFELGRGLGMSGVYNTIKKYNGDITITSSGISKGTTFEIVFPVSNEKEATELETTKQKDKTSFNVLWVDDDTSITEDVSDLMELMGHNCDIANNGKNALAYLDKNDCDIVFTDIGMVGMNGWELIAAIRKDFGNEIKIVTVSGWSIDAKTKEEHTIDFVLQKPYTVEKLEKLLLTL
ncbi:hybrid sensor histidine kinase/response regulator [Polaribacter glomeratus]|uniref:histidine kinase n=1 Tax=Polaribacter glomeratus TaxID=102 RepID=A0A2S7WX34_9FLAO|nr:PAS domain S-box protein [Polaribacter glomeratus]PQJ82159.1 histidine kinase [Polaribacter glomeratus]TXD66754.1 PAS domain S-box protein [Polaribacter glomeratus]